MLRPARVGGERHTGAGARGLRILRLELAAASSAPASPGDERADAARVNTALETVVRGLRLIIERQRVVGRDRSPERVATLVCRHMRVVLADESPEVADAVVVGTLLWAAAMHERPTLALDGPPPVR